MRTFIIIQARTTSTRLPKKVLLPLCNKTVLEVMLDRLSSYKENIIIATTNDGSEEGIVNICQKHNIKFYQGDANNVLKRFYEAALKYGLNGEDIVIRCTSDCPFIDKGLLSSAIKFYKNSKSDYISLGQHSGFPRGLDIEIFNFTLLKEAYENATSEYEKEHVTPYFYITKKDRLIINYFENKRDDSKYRITLDEIDDYKAIKELYSKFNNEVDFSYEELIKKLNENTYIYEINSHVEQKKREDG